MAGIVITNFEDSQQRIVITTACIKMINMNIEVKKTAGLPRILLSLACILLFVCPNEAYSAPPHANGSGLRKVPTQIGDTSIQSYVADSDRTRIDGLLVWNTIGENQGLLLDFVRPGEYAIHMQGMKFPIDAVWIDEKDVITLVYKNIQPNSNMTYPAMFPVRYCLELKAGFCKRHNVRIGQKVTFSK